ncbi:MAG: PHP domain-containing protein [Deltaproteobacteria bacterium]|nr:PHP domain-containing protein [Deltaproteobacteria bacterium]
MLDLHLHSRASDGTSTPADVIRHAAKRGATVVALTDHDTTLGLAAARTAAEQARVRFLSGIEISATDGDETSIHVLGYGFDETSPELARGLIELAGARCDRNVLIAARLAALGMPVDLARIEGSAEGTVGRPHFARALIDLGYVRSFDDAFDRWLGNGRPAYVARSVVSTSAAAELVHRAGGIAVLAHPLVYARDPLRTEARFARAKAEGFDGVEVFHPGHSAGERDMLRWFARQHGLLMTGGSDLHDLDGPTQLAPLDCLDPILARIERSRAA